MKQQLQEFLQSCSPQHLQMMNSQCQKHLEQVLSRIGKQQVLGVYQALSDELALNWTDFMSLGYCLGFPMIIGDGVMKYCLVKDNSDIGQMKQNITISDQQAAQEVLPQVVLVPGLAFTAQGYRLGRGKGYFDRYLEQHGKNLVSIGVGWQRQVQESLPVEDHDQKCDYLVTEEKIYCCI